jgi:P-type Ca2+ transporter type 2C
LIKDSEALKSPRYAIGAGFKAKEHKHKFAFSPRQLGRLVNSNKSLLAFYAFSGLAGLERGLRTDRHCSLSSKETVLDGFVFFNGANNNLILRDTNKRASKEEEALALFAITKAMST